MIRYILLLPVLLMIFLLYIPDLFPYCSCCNKKKIRKQFKIHKATSINPSYKGHKSVCKKCCTKYNIENIYDLEKVRHIQKSIEIRLRSL